MQCFFSNSDKVFSSLRKRKVIIRSSKHQLELTMRVVLRWICHQYLIQLDLCRLCVHQADVNWRASEASETLSGLFNRESRIYILLCIIYSTCNFVLITRKKAERNFEIAARTLCLRVCRATPRFTAEVKIPLPRQHFSSRILFDRKRSESYFF